MDTDVFDVLLKGVGGIRRLCFLDWIELDQIGGRGYRGYVFSWWDQRSAGSASALE